MQLTKQQQQNEIAIDRMIGSMQSRKSWIPPREIMAYVCDTLTETFGFDITQFNPLWIPVCITASVDWVRITGWWPYYYTSTFHSGEEYKFVWKYVGAGSMEMDPTFYKIFRDDAQASMFEVRRTHPGLSNMEKTEVVSFIRDTYCTQLKVPKPPIEAVERAVWATLMWMCDTYGKDWLYNQSHLISSCHDFGMGFVHSLNVETPPDVSEVTAGIDIRDTQMREDIQIIKDALAFLDYPIGVSWELITDELFESFAAFKEHEQLEFSPIVCENTLMALKLAIEGKDLLNPKNMVCTERPVGSCSNCGQNLWCVSTYHVQMDVQGSTFLCSACANGMSESARIFDTSGENMIHKCESCLNQQCPHIKVETDQYGVAIPKIVMQAGSKQLEAYRQYLLQQPSGTMHGITAEDMAGYYAGNRLGQNSRLGGE